MQSDVIDNNHGQGMYQEPGNQPARGSNRRLNRALRFVQAGCRGRVFSNGSPDGENTILARGPCLKRQDGATSRLVGPAFVAGNAKVAAGVTMHGDGCAPMTRSTSIDGPASIQAFNALW